MTTTIFSDLRNRNRSRHRGSLRNAFEGVLGARGHRVRRCIAGVMVLYGGERLDLCELERRSFVDPAAPERC